MAKLLKAPSMILAAMLLAAGPGAAQLQPTPPAALPPLPEVPRQEFAPVVPQLQRSGRGVEINGLAQQAAWLWVGSDAEPPRQLWLPLEVLQGQLGFSSRSKPDGSLDLEWFGRGQVVPPAAQRALQDEVAVDVAAILEATGVRATLRGVTLVLQLPSPRLLQVRSANQPGVRRVVLDLAGPAVVRSNETGVQLGLQSDPNQILRLGALGVRGRQTGDGLRLTPAGGAPPSRVFTLGQPPRVVIDLPGPAGASDAAGGAGAETATGPAATDPRLQALLGREVRWDRVVRQVGSRRIRINAVRVDPRTTALVLRPLSRPEGMQGLSSLPGLARRYDALVAVNGGYFNRVRRLPLGALKDQGRWLSGPILNRGVVAWEPRGLPRFGRLRLEEWLTDERGTRWPVQFVNSGFVQRGLSRYTADWGPLYRALSSTESALLLRGDVVQERIDASRLARGVPLASGDMLVVSRSSAPLPWNRGDTLTLTSRPSSDLGLAPNVLGGGPLLLLDGQAVLNGGAEGFGTAFLRQGAPRTVIGGDGRFLWLVTLEGVDDEGPTLEEATLALQQIGLRDALNLDGGSSTGLVMGGSQAVKGRGVVGLIHNGLGLVPGGG